MDYLRILLTTINLWGSGYFTFAYLNVMPEQPNPKPDQGFQIRKYIFGLMALATGSTGMYLLFA